MITRAYLENIFNKAKITCMPYEDKYMCMLCELQNGTIIHSGSNINCNDVATAINTCKEEILFEIEKYERYLQADKEKYNYDLANEYFAEYGEGGNINE